MRLRVTEVVVGLDRGEAHCIDGGEIVNGGGAPAVADELVALALLRLWPLEDVRRKLCG